MTTGRNYWATFKDPLIRWYIELPPAADLGMERVFDLTQRVVESAEREQVMRILEAPSPRLFKQGAGWTWLDYVRERFNRTGRVDLFPGGGPTYQRGGRLRLPARLAYYKGDRIVEEDVEDPGLLLLSLDSPESPEPITVGDIGRYSIPPIQLRCISRQETSPGVPPTDELWGSLSLFTDIWFPRVIGANVYDWGTEEPHPVRGRDDMLDNSALAARHTPRLNRFIETLRAAVLELSGSWRFADDEADCRYLPMLHEAGINLDYPAAST